MKCNKNIIKEGDIRGLRSKLVDDYYTRAIQSHSFNLAIAGGDSHHHVTYYNLISQILIASLHCPVGP